MNTNTNSQPPAAGEAAHTPTPWRKRTLSGFCGGRTEYRIIASDQSLNGQRIIARLFGPDAQSNAAFIVRACNAHEKVCGLLARAMESVRDESLRNEINETLRSL